MEVATTTSQELINQFAELGLTLTIYNNDRNGKPSARCTQPSKSRSGFKVLIRYYFESEERRIEYLTTFYNNRVKIMADKAAEKAKTKELNAVLKASDHFKVGDIVTNTWGWEQTNVDIYKVTEVKNKTIKVIEIGQKVEPGSEGMMSCSVLPDPEVVLEKTYLLRLKTDGKGGARICDPASYYYFSKWDGRSMYKSWYA